jgi:ribonuclease P protein component
MAVLRVGRRRRTPRLDIAWYPNDTGHPRLGVIVPRYGRTAVARNTLRRRLREIARRRLLPGMPALDLVLRPRPDAYHASFDHLAGDLETWRHSL